MSFPKDNRDNVAMYWPNRGNTVQLEVFGMPGKREGGSVTSSWITATHDALTNCSENRHFVDETFWRKAVF